MRLLMQQKALSMAPKFTIKDEEQNDIFYVEGKVFSLKRILNIYDAQRNHIATIFKEPFRLKPTFVVQVNGETIATVVKEVTFFKDKYTISGLDWEVEGKVLFHEYTFTKDGEIIASMYKNRFSWGDSFVLDVDEEDAIPAVGVVLAIDMVIDAKK